MALPNVDRYRDDIVASIERASGMKVAVGAIRGGWEGLRPGLTLTDFRLADRQGRAGLAFERAEVTLAWWALAIGQLRFADAEFHRPELTLRRAADGLIYLGDKPLNAAGPDDGTFAAWLLSQPRLGIHQATLTWRDELAGGREVRLGNVEIAVRRRFGRHHAALTAAPPRELASKLDVRLDAIFRRDGEKWRASGEVYAETLQANLAGLRAFLPVPETLRTGAGSLRVWAGFQPTHVTEVVADLAMRDVKAQLDDDALPLDLATLSGRATYRALQRGFTVATEGLRFRLAGGDEAHPGDFFMTRGEESGKLLRTEVRANGIDLKIAAALIDYLPVPKDMKAQVRRFAPRGRIAQSRVTWTGDAARPVSAYALQGSFEDLAVNAVDGLPGVSGLTGSVEGTEAAGVLLLGSRNATLEIQRIFREALAFETLEARARWRHVGRALEVSIDEARASNKDAEAEVKGVWRSLPDAKVKSPGYADLKGSFTRATMTSLARYLPNNIVNLREYLDAAILGGQSPRLAFEVKGDLYEFPFGPGSEGLVRVEGALRDGKLRYHPEWPTIDGIQGSLKLENRRLEVRAERAAIFASRMTNTAAVIEDLRGAPPVLVIDGTIDTTGADSMRFLRESPLVSGPGAFTRVVAVEGPAKLKLHIEFPFTSPRTVRVAGDYAFDGATATLDSRLAMTDLRGRLAFTERGVRANDLAGFLFGRPATLSMATQPDGYLVTTLDGRIDAGALAEYVPAPLAARMKGEAAWKARVANSPQGVDLTLTSDLQGLAVNLPAPMAKPAGEARALTVAIARLGGDNEAMTATLAGAVHGRFGRVGPENARRWNAALKVGSPVAAEPVREGLWLYGALPALDVDAWQDVFALPPAASAPPAAAPIPPDASGFGLRGVDLRLGRVRFLGRDFADLNANLARVGSQWSGRLESPRLAGEVAWNPEGRGRARARLERLAVDETAAGVKEADAKAPEGDRGSLPALDVVAERFEFHGRWLGKLELDAKHVGEEWRIDRLDIGNDHAQMKSSGVWRRTGAGGLTTLAIKVDVENLNALFGQFGWGEYMRRGTGKLEGTLVWPGYANDFSTAILSGAFKVEARRGQFSKIEPGAGKLLGLLSLQSLPRRATFDFRDVFSDGFAFEKIEGDVKLARGVLLTENFEISGPSAFVSISGEVSLPQESQALTVRVVPEVGESMALAATLIGTPVLGLSTLLVSKLLRNPLGKVVAYEYQVTGSWDNPQVARTSAPPARSAAAASPEDASVPKAATP